jgi:hypothetical protein
MLYFVTVKTEEKVHAQALGFTNFVFYYAEAQTAEDAGKKVENYVFREYKITAKTVSCSVAREQNKAKYVFPEAIID